MTGLAANTFPSGILSLVVYILLVASSQAEHDASNSKHDEFGSSLRGQQQRHRELKRPDYPCILVRVETEYEQVEVEEGSIFSHFVDNAQQADVDEVRCELSEVDVAKAGGQYFVPIMGIENSQLNYIESGVSTLVAEGAVLMDGALQIPQGAAIEIGTVDDVEFNDGEDEGGFMRWRSLRMQQGSRRMAQVGTKKVLVVRANAYDSQTTGSRMEISNNIFGTGGDKVTLKSQYEQCSHGKLVFEPYDNGNGVIEVNIHTDVNGKNRFDIEKAMTSAAENQMGNLANQYDHVMLCMPPGTGSWVAYAYVNSWLSVYNDEWCQQLSTLVHEMGHNMGLAHSGKDGNPYADRSGMMGFSYKGDDTPQQCFNPAKSYQLGWYSDCVVEWNPSRQGTWAGVVVGVADYGTNSNGKTCVIRIPRPRNGEDLYIGYNRKKNMNSDVMDSGDKVTIIEKEDGYKVSNFIAGLHPNAGTKQVFYNFEYEGRNLVVEFSSYGSSIDEAFVAIYFDDCEHPCWTTAPQPPTPLPTAAPVPVPSDPQEEDDDPNKTPIIFEMLPNPRREEAEYIEIFNPHSSSINLSDYLICVQNGRNREPRCDQLMEFNLDPGAYFMLCRNKLYVADSRTCHQVGDNLNFKDRRKQFVTLQQITNGSEVGTVTQTVVVDKLSLRRPKKFPDYMYIRKSGRMGRFCASCWTWWLPPL